jgi:transposase
MNANAKPYPFFCGIDVHKYRHVASVMDRDGEILVRSQVFANHADGFAQCLRRLQTIGPPHEVLVGMEATGHYWYGLYEFLQSHGYAVAVLNPIQTAQEARKRIRKAKTDKISARDIAQLLKNGQHRPSQVPGPLAMTCRQLTRLRYALRKQQTRLKQLIRSRLHPAWPEYEACFADPFCVTSRALLKTAPTPQDLLSMELDAIGELLRKVSRGKLGAAAAQRVWDAAGMSVGIQRGREGVRIAIDILLETLEAYDPIAKRLEQHVEAIADRLPAYLRSLPNATPLRVASLYGEIDPVETFSSPDQLVAFAGLDTVVDESGQRGTDPSSKPRRRISKRGSPYLRRTLWLMAHRACYLEGDLRTYFLRKRAHGLHHLAAVTAVATKLTRIVWRVMTDRRDYLPQAPSDGS